MISRRAIARRAAGGKRAVGRDSMSSPEYAMLKTAVFERAGYRCECCRVKPAIELDHAIPRARGGGDNYDNCSAICRECHRQKDAPFANGRLVVVPLGGGKFRWEEWRGPTKWLATLIRVVRDSSL